MTFIIKDRVFAYSNSTGASNFVLEATKLGYRNWSDIGDTNSTYYTIVADNGDWEVGQGIYLAANNELQRVKVYSNSQGNQNKIVFDTGLKEVFCGLPAEEFNRTLKKDLNLSDLTDFAQARANLGFGSAAVADVVQTTGSSLTDVMSQDAVTKEIASVINSRGYVSVKDFGAVGDGTDEQIKVQAALDAAGGVAPTMLDLNGLTVRCDAPLTVPQGVRVQNGTLDFSNVSDATRGLIAINGYVESAIYLSANASAYTNEIFVDPSGFVAGDIIKITSNARPLGGNSDEYIGEFNIVREVRVSSLLLVKSTEDDYLVADGAYIQKVVMSTGCEISHVTVKGKPNVNGVPPEVRAGNIGISALYCSNLKIENCSFVSCDYQSIAIDSCLNFDVRQNEIYLSPAAADIDNPLRYGIAVKNASCGGRISSNWIVNGRHAVNFTSNQERGITRDVAVSGNVVNGTWGAAYATHQGSDRIVFDSNFATYCVRGFDIRHGNCEITNNTVTIKSGGFLGEGIALSRYPRKVRISGNRIYKSAIGIRAYDTNLEADSIPSDIVIQNNYIESIQSDGIFLQQTRNNSLIKGLSISNNTFNAKRDAIRVDGNFSVPIIHANQMISDGSQTGYGINLFGTAGAIIDGNAFLGMVPIRLQDSGNSPAIVPNNPLLINNKWDRQDVSIVSQISGTNVVRKDNVQAGSINPVIAAGVIAVPAGAPFIIVDTEGGAATDDLDTINGGDSGGIAVFTISSNFRSVVFKDGVGNLRLNGDFTLSTTRHTITLIRTGVDWRELARSANG